MSTLRSFVRPFARRSAVTALVLACIAVAPSVARAAEPDSIWLRFGWHPGDRADVTFETSRTRRGAGGNQDVKASLSWRMEVEDHAEGLRIRTDSLRFTEGVSGGDASAMQNLLQSLGSAPPASIVSDQGAFVRIENVARLREAVAQAARSSIGSIDSMPPGVRSMMDQVLSDQTLTALAAEEWNVAIGTWVDSDWELGDVATLESETPSPTFPDLTFPMVTTFEALRRVPCGEGGAAGCVEMRLASAPEPERLRSNVEDLLARIDPSQRDQIRAALSTMNASTEATVTMRPTDMRPYVVRKVRRVTAQVRPAPDAAPQDFVQEDVRITRYTWMR